MLTKIALPLSKKDISELSELSKYSPFGQSFWQVTKDVLQNDRNLKIFRCSCSNLFFIEDSERKKIEKIKIKSCFCQTFYENSPTLKDNIVEAQLKDAAVKLKNNEKNEAMHVCRHILPTDNFASFDLAFWRLQVGLAMKDYYSANSNEKREMFQQQYFRDTFNLVEKAKKKNQHEVDKLFQYLWEKDSSYNEKIMNAVAKRLESSDIFEVEAYQSITGLELPSSHPKGTKNDLIKRSVQYFLDSYLSYVEISEIYLFFINIIRIINGEDFTSDVTQLEIIVNGKKRKLLNRKGNYLEWIIQNDSTGFSSKIQLAIDNQLRNDTAGHNDYIVDVESLEVTNTTSNNSYSFKEIRVRANRIKALIDAVTVNIEIARYIDKTYLNYCGIHGMLIHFEQGTKKPKNFLTIYQFWSNANLDSEGKTFDCASFKYFKKLVGKQDAVVFSPGSIIPIPTNAIMPLEYELSEWLNELVKQKKLILKRVVIAPAISYFKDVAIAQYQDEFMNFFVLGESIHELPIQVGLVKKIVKRIRNKKNLSHMNLNDINLIKPLPKK